MQRWRLGKNERLVRTKKAVLGREKEGRFDGSMVRRGTVWLEERCKFIAVVFDVTSTKRQTPQIVRCRKTGLENLEGKNKKKKENGCLREARLRLWALLQHNG